MDHARVPEAVFVFQGEFNRMIDVLRADERDERHHLLFGDERV